MTIAPIDLVMIVLLVFEFHEKPSPSRLAVTLWMAARRETKEVIRKGEHVGYYLTFLDRLGEAVLNTGGGKDAQSGDGRRPASRAATDGRLHTDVPILASVLCTVGGAPVAPYAHSDHAQALRRSSRCSPLSRIRSRPRTRTAWRRYERRRPLFRTDSPSSSRNLVRIEDWYCVIGK